MTAEPLPPEQPLSDDAASTRRRHRRTQGKHLLDHLAVVRNHPFVAIAVFLLVTAGLAAQALLAEPVYASFATIQIESEQNMEMGFLSELAGITQASPFEAELEVIRSIVVARHAAQGESPNGKDEEQKAPRVLAAGTEAVPPSNYALASIHERNAFRPLEMALRWLRREKDPPRLGVRAPPLESGAAQWLLAFRPDGSIVIHASLSESAPTVEVAAWQDDEPIQAFGSTIYIRRISGDPTGKTFVLTRRSVEAAAKWIKAGTTVETIGPRTGIVQIAFRTDTPEGAAEVANAVANGYAAYRQERRSEHMDARLRFLQDEIEALNRELKDLGRSHDQYLVEENAVFLGERGKAMLDEQGELLRQRFEQEQILRNLNWRLAEIQGDLSSERALLILASDAVDSKTSALAGQLVQLETERALQDRQNVPPDNPKYKQITDEIAEIEKRLNERLAALTERQRAVLERQIEDVNRRLEQIGAEYDRMQEQLAELPKLERNLLTRLRPLRVREQMYEYLVKLEKESQVAQKSLQPMVHLLDPAEVSYVRASPNLTRSGLLALMAGVVAAIAATFLVEYMDRSVKSPQELEQGLGLPIYAAIPAFSSVRRRERKRLTGPLVSRDQPSSVLAEAYRSLRANIRFAQADRTIKTMAITSSVEQEGKTVTTLNLAIAMANAGDKVIVVDADMRRPTTHVHLEGNLEPGLVDVLRGEASWREIVHETDVAGLHVLHAGREPQNPGALLDSAAFTSLLDDLRARYDYVLFDVPPVLAVADAAAFFRQLDGIFLLSRYRRCSLDLVDGAREQIERLGGRILGAIFNGFDARRSARRGYGYYGYYGYYSRYGGYGRRSSRRGKPSKNKA